MPRLFCFGYSYTARALGAHLGSSAQDQDWQITATIRDETEREALAAVGIEAHLFASDDSRQALTTASHILISVPPASVQMASAPPGKSGDPVLEAYSETLAVLKPAWLGYLSTTGPYGDCGGAWVDEAAPARPSGERGQRRLGAERAWTSLCLTHHLPLHIFRLPGLYGPGRSALDRVRDGTARRIIKPGQVFSRIHIDDLAAILKASMERPRAIDNGPALYNVADDLPSPPQDVTTFAAELLGVTPPPEIPFEDADLTPMARSFYADNKRISNALVKSELGITLKYPTWREGLKAIHDSET